MRIIYQNEVADCGYACLAMVLTHLGRATDVREITARRPLSANGLTLMDLYDVATDFGLAVQPFQFDASDLTNIKPGSILHFGGAHFVVFEKFRRSHVVVIDPASGRRRLTLEMFMANVSGYLLECSPTPQLPSIRAHSRVPGALTRVHALNPQLRGHIAKLMFVAIGGQFAILTLPYFGNLVLDHVVTSDNRNLLHILAVTFTSIFAIGAFSKFIQSYLVALAGTLVSVNVTQGLVGQLLRNPISYFEKRNVGDLFARLKSQEEINDYAVRTSFALRIDLVVAGLAIALMLIQSTLLAGVALTIFALYLGTAFALYVPMRDAHMLVLERSAQCDDTLIETIRGASLIKLACGETRRTAIFMAKFRANAAAALHSAKLTATRDAVLKLVEYADVIAITWLAAGLMLDGRISVGVFYSFMIYKSLASERLAQSINALFGRFMLSVPVQRVADIVEHEPERYGLTEQIGRTAELQRLDSIVVRDLNFSYGLSDRTVLSGVTLDIQRGDKIAIVGPSGVGKSTLFKLLCAAEPVQQGEIRLNGVSYANLAVDEIRQHMTQMRQGDLILNGSIADNISLFGANPDHNRINQLLKDVGLLDDVMQLPMRTQTVISDSIANISAGQRQRLLLARTLYQDAEVLLLDEPTSNLDPVSVAHIAALLQRLERTLIVITHDLSLATCFKHSYQLIDGTLRRRVRQEEGLA
ncbi:peptidase domain-containing ABC transporter [Pseudomonas sp. PDM23]|uniref:peptidase domain-containing ABC transporter n=1 Tax=unclassified Pseudomonas TaxID=196821 RepID=UPI00177E2839|nr:MULTISPECIES: peptidase domain-containing ABC transporter [unclassified Pseudomonas]MBD9578607.1 peptidase domain-containing ABC transporter [Pseudomonas sp. PDM23]MBD9674387.1 peptidase domain-containing ABC transporter [Pseudomonas sp. PDM21]